MAEEAISCNNGFPESESNSPAMKKKRNLPGTPDPEAEVIALSPKTLMATNRFLCEICGKGFQRDQNLQLHRRGHNLPWKLKQRTNKEARKRVYVCPEKTCVHHHPSRALGDLTGIKKHFCRKHGEKKWKCEKCSKRYAVQSDWKAHSKTCGTREYKCDCGTLFSRRDSFITHRAFCDALAEETARVNAASKINTLAATNFHFMGNPPGSNMAHHLPSILKPFSGNDQSRWGISLWMNQGLQSHEQVGSNNVQEIQQQGSLGLGAILGHPIVSCSYPPQADYRMDSTGLGNKPWPSNGEELTSISLPSITVKEAAAPPVSVRSMYSTEQQSHQVSSVSMSATALLQKAALLGATSSESSKVGSIGFNGNNIGVQDLNKLCGLYGPNPISTTYVIGDYFENSESDICDFSQMQMHPAKRQKLHSLDESSGGQTRDFLGVVRHH
ncbi:hypothetical protein K2173_006708 [Erythroxylum novogranatense]|uniref:C2H2-type domain-containing protein n=1 Tax=Erythroxylum novogranatense TaxID=1862640 RepID=A0AAV8TDY8_9ROSI|nr:hypothetical protein K2173_006708 [Erythroxylum novogranatense]